jgi:hypothetical protein
MEVLLKEEVAAEAGHRDPEMYRKYWFRLPTATAGCHVHRRFFLPAIQHFVVVFHHWIREIMTQVQTLPEFSLNKAFMGF